MMRRPLFALALAVALSATLSGAPPAALAQTANRSLPIRNDTTQEVYAVYTARVGTDAWGPDLLGSDTIQPGQTHQATRPAAGAGCRVAVRYILKPGPEVIQPEVDICAVPSLVVTEAEAITQQRRAWRLHNTSRTTLMNLYILQPGATERGEDRFGPISLEAGASFYVRRPPSTACTADVIVRSTGGAESTRAGIDLCSVDVVTIDDLPADAATEEDAAPSGITVINRTGQAAQSLFISAVSQPNWGDNRLTQPLQSGERFSFEAPGDNHCLYDVRLVLADGTNQDRMMENFCQISELLFEHIARGGDKRP
ncbi:MAG: hypothetical protein SF002_06900 [Alphaproteobacteria bacterium]|nr:hypothetical protein [Alphaproteobacteria bacterium]